MKGLINLNLPNKLTIMRFVLSLVFLALMMIEFPHHYLAALLVFIVASVTDLLDGMIARKRNLITNFGKFLDPIADKMLTTAAFLAFLAWGYGFGIVWITFIVLAREFVVTSVRLIAADNGKVIAANFWGKLKTVMQMVAIMVTIAAEYFISEFIYSMPLVSVDFIAPIRIVYSCLLWISAIFTLIAGITYIADNKSFFSVDK